MNIRQFTLVDEFGEERSIYVEDYQPRKNFTAKRRYGEQFSEIEEEALRHISEDSIREYAEFHLDMVEECEEKTLDDFSDDEIEKEHLSRQYTPFGTTSMLQVEIQKLCDKIVDSNNYRVIEELEKIIEKYG
jgi:hypothetical protein